MTLNGWGVLSRKAFVATLGLAVFCLAVAAFLFPDAPAPTADRVFGQPDFTSTGSGTGPSQNQGAAGIVFDDSGVMYVSDLNNGRILVFTDQADTVADTIVAATGLGVGSGKLNAPWGIAVWNGAETTVLFAADNQNNRVVAYLVRTNSVLNTVFADTIADYVFGQPTFDTNLANGLSGAPSANTMNAPINLCILDTGLATFSLFVSDQTNRRVLRFDLAKNRFGSAAIDTTADAVWGEPHLDTNAYTAPSNSSLASPAGVCVTSDRLYIVDQGNNRVVVESLTDGDTLFDAVYGQPNMAGSTDNDDTTGLNQPNDIAMDRFRTTLAISDNTYRVLLHSDTTGVDTTADAVVGDTDFNNQSRLVGATAQTLQNPYGLFFRGLTELWVCDPNRNRVLRFDGTQFAAVSSTTLAVGPLVSVSSSAPANVGDTVPRSTSDSYVQVNLAGGGTTSGTLASAANATGADANYRLTTRLINSFDTVAIYVWTKEPTPAIFLGLRTDSSSLDGANFPAGVANNDTGRRAIAATSLLVRFGNSSGRLIGDSSRVVNVGETFAYTLAFTLSETTCRLFREMGFDTSTGSTSFRHYFADTYGGPLRLDTSATVSCTALTGGGALITISGITLSGVDPLGGASATAAAAKSDGACAIEMLGTPRGALAELRAVRDLFLGSTLGRFLAAAYYAFSRLLL